MTKAKKVLPLLSKIHTIKPNVAEAELLSGIKVTDEASLLEAAEKITELGVKHVYLSMGEEGVMMADETGVHRFTSCPAEVKNTTGAGDAFLAGLVWAYLKNCDPKQTVQAAAACAAIAVESEETINEKLSEESMRRRTKDVKQVS